MAAWSSSWFGLLPPLWKGLETTLLVYLGALPIAALVAMVMGFVQLRGSPLLSTLARWFVAVFRGNSALVLLFWAYFTLPSLGVHLSAGAAGCLVLGLNVGAYGAEVVRGGLASVPRGQWEAARVLGFSRWQVLRHVVWPQAFVVMLPGCGNLSVELLKATSLVSLITLSDLTFMGLVVREQTLRTVDVFALVLVLYFVVATAMTSCTRLLERRLSVYRAGGPR